MAGKKCQYVINYSITKGEMGGATKIKEKRKGVKLMPFPDGRETGAERMARKTSEDFVGGLWIIPVAFVVVTALLYFGVV